MVFDSPEIFGEPARSLGLACSTCHNRSDINQRFFIPGISPQPGAADVDGSFFNARFNDHRADALDIPSLRGIRFTGPYGRDGRFASLRDFVRNVIVNEFNGQEPSPLVLDALVAYMLEFDFLPAPYLNFDGTLTALAPPAAKRGEALFQRPFAQMGNRSCASCHVPDSPLHRQPRAQYRLGRRRLWQRQRRLRHADPARMPTTPRPISTTARWRPWATWSPGSISASRSASAPTSAPTSPPISRSSATGEAPYQAFDDENTPFRLMADELSVFLSTLDTLIPARDQVAADLVLRTVAADLTADASVMTNRAAVAKAHEMADLLWQLRRCDRGRRLGSGRRASGRSYQALEQEYQAELR